MHEVRRSNPLHSLDDILNVFHIPCNAIRVEKIGVQCNVGLPVLSLCMFRKHTSLEFLQ